jgi:16S rRNA (guanine(966)-N(2))-methyltransferase RsmD
MTLRVIAGKYKGRSLKTPKATSTRPTQGMLREAVFNICQNEIEGAFFLDLFAGSGAMGFEAISRGAAKATLVEQNRQALLCIKENIETLKIGSEVELLPMDASRAVQVLAKKKALFNIVYIDPPYDTPVKDFLDPLPSLLAPNAIVFVEERSSPKSISKPYESPSLILKDSRRFGVALLHQYRLSGT